MKYEDDDMKLYVDKESSLKTVQTRFNEYYPFLRIEFLKKNLNGQQPAKVVKLNADEVLRKAVSGDGKNIIDINRKRTVAEIEKDMEDVFGLAAQIFRRSGNVWIETSLTDDWTLEEQNKEGKQISAHFE